MSRVKSSLKILGVTPNNKLDLNTLEVMEKRRDKDEEGILPCIIPAHPLPELLYHISLIDLLSRCCLGFNHIPELMCQSILPLDDILDVLINPDNDPLVRAAYCRALNEVSEISEKSRRKF
jgi:hypothetical protein